MLRLRQIVSGTAVCAMVLSFAVPVSAQSTPADVEAEPRVQLAAVTPGSSDLPTGYTFVGETFLDADQASGPGIDAAAIQEAGFATQYVSVYENVDSGERIRAYASWWGDEAAATSGFEILENEGATNPNDMMEDSAAEVGEEPRETTTGSYLAADGSTVGMVDVTFRRGPMVIGVAHEKMDGSAADPAIAADLAARMDERAQTVLSGESPQHTDLSLPGNVISFAAEGNAVLQVGFLGPAEVESIYGVQGSLLSGVNASWVETAMIGTTDPAGPTITVGVATFGSEDDARSTAEQAGDLFTPLENQEAADAPSIDGANATTAFRYTSEGVDAFRVVFAIGPMLTVIDAQGPGAEEAVAAIVTAQAACQTGGTCEAPSLPESFTGQ